MDETIWLYMAMELIAVGGTGLRMAGYQFCNLFPKYRSTALSILSGSYAASAGLFMIFQVGQQNGLSLRFMSFNVAGLAVVILLFTIIMPWHNVSHNENDQKESSSKIPLIRSIISISSFTYLFWRTLLMNAQNFYTLYFNSWISQIAKTNEEAGNYTILNSITGYGCILTAPLAGFLNDFIMQKAEKGKINVMIKFTSIT
ncbi:hypothetical protein Avbf_16692 [Armadillidium vulgare]|nr:hypothetical protein Avbf_16692 [Armadillidium vulgare]